MTERRVPVMLSFSKHYLNTYPVLARPCWESLPSSSSYTHTGSVLVLLRREDSSAGGIKGWLLLVEGLQGRVRE